MLYKIVNKEIIKHIKPVLRNAGFTISSGRSFWRHRADRAEVVNFQSFTSYYSVGERNVPVSGLAINLGIFLFCVSERTPLKRKNDLILPAEYQCHFRRCLSKGIKQRFNTHEISYLFVDGLTPDDVIKDVSSVFETTGFPWFECFWDTNELLRTLLEDKEMGGDGTWGLGNLASPWRRTLTACVAKKMGRMDIFSANLD